MSNHYKGIPAPMLAPLSATRWQSDDYSLNKFQNMLDCHQAGDQDFGFTCQVFTMELDGGVSDKELAALRPYIPGEFVGEAGGINQHYMFSLEQFNAEVQKAWDDHVGRTNALIGTPSGRISREVIE
jgi:hypothetical protein